MGNVLGWFGLKKSPPTPTGVRRERSPPLKAEKPQRHDALQPTQSSCPSSQTIHESTFHVTLQPKPKDEDPGKVKVSAPPKEEMPAGVSKPATAFAILQSSPKQTERRPPERPPAPKQKMEGPSEPLAVSSKEQENVQSLAKIAKEEVRNLTENTSKTCVDSAERTVKITSSTSLITTLKQEHTPPVVTSPGNRVQSKVISANEAFGERSQKLFKSSEPFEVVVVCPPCAEDKSDKPATVWDDTECSQEDEEHVGQQDTAEEAAVKIQAGIRGYLTRKALKDRFSPAPESLTGKHTETAQPETKTDTDIGKSTEKTSSAQAQETCVKAQDPAGVDRVATASKGQSPSIQGQELQITREILTERNTVSTQKISVKSAEPAKKEETSARPAEAVKTQPQIQIAEAVAKASHIIRTEMPQQTYPSKVNAPPEEEEEEEEEEWDEEEEEEEDIVLEEEEPTPPASPSTQIKKLVVTPPGAPSSGRAQKQ